MIHGMSNPPHVVYLSLCMCCLYECAVHSMYLLASLCIYFIGLAAFDALFLAGGISLIMSRCQVCRSPIEPLLAFSLLRIICHDDQLVANDRL